MAELTIGEIKKVRGCCCSCEIDLKSFTQTNDLKYYEINFNINSEECWAGQELTVCGVTFTYEAQNGFIVEGDASELGVKVRYHSAEGLEELIGYDIYSELTHEDYDGSGDNHAELKVNILREYIEENGLVTIIDNKRGFGNEWDLYLIKKEGLENFLEGSVLEQIEIEDALKYVKSSFTYEYDCTHFYEVAEVTERV